MAEQTYCYGADAEIHKIHSDKDISVVAAQDETIKIGKNRTIDVTGYQTTTVKGRIVIVSLDEEIYEDAEKQIRMVVGPEGEPKASVKLDDGGNIHAEADTLIQHSVGESINHVLITTRGIEAAVSGNIITIDKEGKICIIANSKISIMCGDSSIILSESEIELSAGKAKINLNSSSGITINGGPGGKIKLNT